MQMGSLGLTVAVVQPVQHDLRIACSNGVAFQRIRRDFFGMSMSSLNVPDLPTRHLLIMINKYTVLTLDFLLSDKNDP